MGIQNHIEKKDWTSQHLSDWSKIRDISVFGIVKVHMYQFLVRTGGAMQILKLKMRNRWSIIPVCNAVTWSQIFRRQRTSVAFLLFCQLWQEQIINKYFETLISNLKIIVLFTTSFHENEFIIVTIFLRQRTRRLLLL